MVSGLIPQLVWVATSAALIASAFAPIEARFAPFVALVPALQVLARVATARAALLGALFGTLYSALVTWWLYPTISGYFGQGLLVTCAFLIGFWFATGGVFLALCFALLAQLRARLGATAWIALAPAVWVAIELVRSYVGLRSPWAKLGETLHPYAEIRQLASAAGVYSLSALAVLANVALFELLELGLRRGSARRAASAAAALALAFSSAWIYGHGRRAQLREESVAARSLEVAAIQANVPSEITWKRSTALRVFERHAALTVSAAREGRLDLVLWPEQALQTSPDDPQLALGLNLLLEELRVPLLAGAVRSESGAAGARVFNSALLLRSGAGPHPHYDKMRLLPFSETQPLGDWLQFREDGDLAPARYAAGNEVGVIAWEGPPLGVSICFEGTYPQATRALAEGGARVLVNLANDSWFRGRGGPEQHFAELRFRAIETGLPLVRAASTGISAVVLPDGSIARELGHGSHGALRARVPWLDSGTTLYTRSGDVFAWNCCAASGFASLAGAARARRAMRRALGPASEASKRASAAGHGAVTTA